ncbi:isochorismatase family protein [Neisseria sp.]|uniref:isochorismatase family protein n=1 Tax=Neisseria sp. TaxID=192066 RepID=UPI0035A06FC7
MAIVAIDIQPQYRFSCMAANEKRFLIRPESIVGELNRQAQFADKRLLVENTTIHNEALCHIRIHKENELPTDRASFIFNRNRYFSDCNSGCRARELLNGLPFQADYDHSVEVAGSHNFGACFHDAEEKRSTGLIEWLYAQNADTVIIGGLATEEAVADTAKQLSWYNNDLHIIVNLAACCGYTPETTIETVYKMREAGITVVTETAQLTEAVQRIPSKLLSKVS